MNHRWLDPLSTIRRQPHRCSPFRVDMYCVEFGQDLRNLYRGGELCERGDKSLMEEFFFNSPEEIVQRSEFRKSENVVYMQPEQKAGRSPDRPTCTAWCTAAVRSTERSIDCTSQVSVKGRLTIRSTDWHEPRFWCSVDRPVNRRKSTSTGVVDRQSDLLVLSGFELRF